MATDSPAPARLTLLNVAVSISSGTTTTRDPRGRYPLYGSTGRIDSTNRNEHTGPSILVARVGANAGSVYSVDGSYGVTDNTLVIRLKAGQSVSFFTYLLEFTDLNRMVYGSGQPLVTGTMLKSLEVPSVSPREQARIATALDDAASHVAAIERTLAKKQAIKLGMMQQLLTGRTRLPGFNGKWTSRRIDDFTQVKAGGTPSTAVPRYWGGDIRWMSSGEIHTKRVSEVEGRITAVGLRESAAQLLPPGTVLMALAGQGKTRGTVAISRVELSTNQSIAGILPGSEHHSGFLYYNLDTRYDELRGESSGDGGRGGLNLTIIKNLDVFMPGWDEQAAIATVLADVDDEIDALNLRLTKALDMKQGMMQELLTGRTRLPVKEGA